MVRTRHRSNNTVSETRTNLPAPGERHAAAGEPEPASLCMERGEAIPEPWIRVMQNTITVRRMPPRKLAATSDPAKRDQVLAKITISLIRKDMRTYSAHVNTWFPVTGWAT